MTVRTLAVLSLSVLLLSASGCGPSDTEQKILDELVALQGEVHDLAAKVEALEQSPAPARPPRPTSVSTPLSTAGYPVLGRKDAPVTMVEFSDYQCPFCRRHTLQTVPQLKRDYIDTGKVRYVFVDNPIPSHRQAPKAAEAAHCAGEQGKYWQMHDHLFQNQNQIRDEPFTRFAGEVGLDTASFRTCLESGRYENKVSAGRSTAGSIGATGTPTFLIGATQPDGSVTGEVVVGAKAYSVFDQKLKQLLN